MRVVLSEAHLDVPCTLERGQSLLYLIESEEWWVETEWNGRVIGDLFLYRTNPQQQAIHRAEVASKKRGPADFMRGAYWGSVPGARVKCYRFRNGEPTAADVPQNKVFDKASAGAKPQAV